MEKLKTLQAYRITKGNSAGSLIKGDVIWFTREGNIRCVQAEGSITKEEQDDKTMDFECVEEPNYQIKIVRDHESCREIGYSFSLDKK